MTASGSRGGETPPTEHRSSVKQRLTLEFTRLNLHDFYFEGAFMKTFFKNFVTFLIGLGIGGIFLFFLLRDKDLGEMWGHIKNANLLWLLASVLVIFSAYITRVQRWYHILLPVKRTGWYNRFVATIIGFMAVALLPFRVGEIIRPYLLARRENMSKSLTFATIIPVERMFDLAAVISFFALYLIMVPTPVGAASEQLHALAMLKKWSVILVAGIVVAVIFFILLAFRSEKFLKISHRIFSVVSEKWADKLNEILASFVDGLTIIRTGKQFALVYFWSMATWFAIAFAFWCVMAAFGQFVPVYHMFVILFLTAAGAAIPVPAGIGPWHYLAFLGVHYFYGVPENLALGIVFVMHLVGFAVAVLIAPFFAIGELQEIADILTKRKPHKSKKKEASSSS